METSTREESSSSEMEQSVAATSEVDALLDELSVLPVDKANWLTADNHDCGYHVYTEEEIAALATEENGENDGGSEDEDETNHSAISHSQACIALIYIAYL